MYNIDPSWKRPNLANSASRCRTQIMEATQRKPYLFGGIGGSYPRSRWSRAFLFNDFMTATPSLAYTVAKQAQRHVTSSSVNPRLASFNFPRRSRQSDVLNPNYQKMEISPVCFRWPGSTVSFGQILQDNGFPRHRRFEPRSISIAEVETRVYTHLIYSGGFSATRPKCSVLLGQWDLA